MEQETCSHSEKGGQSMPQDAPLQQNQGNSMSGDNGEIKDCQQSEGNRMQAGYTNGNPPVMQQPLGNPAQINMGYPAAHHPGVQPSHPGVQQPNPGMQQPHPGMQQPHPGMQQPHPGMQQPHPGMRQPYPGMQQPQPHPGMQGGHPKQGQSHCSCTDHEQYAEQYGPAHVTEMMGRFVGGNVTPSDVNAIGGFFGIDCQSTRFWTGIALGAVGALILTRSFRSE